MIGDPYAKVGLVAALIAGVWGLGVAVDRLGGRRLVLAGGREGALTPEVPLELPPPDPKRPDKHTALVNLSTARLASIDPGTVQVTTPGYRVDDAQIHPIYEFVKEKNPKPRSILLLMDNSRSMSEVNSGNPPSDPDYQRINAGRLLLERLPAQDRVSLACFPSRVSLERGGDPPRFPFELLAPPERPDLVINQLDSLMGEENNSTPLYQALEQGADLLAQEPNGGKRILILLTDGRNEEKLPSELHSLETAVAAIKAANVDVYAVGLGSKADMPVLNRISAHALRANDATALSRAFSQILLQMTRKVVQMDLDVMVARDGKPIPPGQKVEITFRSGGKLYTTQGKTQ